MSKLSKLQERHRKKTDELQAFANKLITGLQQRSSKLVGCKACGSKIAKDKIEHLPCPVCHATMAGEGAKKRITKMETEIAGLAGSIHEIATKS